MKKILVIGLIALVIIVLLGIYKNYVGYLIFGKSYNETRAKLGVPIIEDTFQPTDDYSMWYSKQRIYPRHAMKLLSLKWLNVEIEQDNFEFVKDSVVVTAFCYYNYDKRCYNVYLSEGGYRQKISCDSLVELLSKEGLQVNMNCKECSDIK
jgi:hypothetical protein